GGLSDYVAQVDGANASAVDEAVVATLRWAAGQIRDHTNLLAFALAELDQVVTTPAGLADAASEAFGLRLKETTDAAGLDGLEALQAGYASAPELAALIDAVFARISEEVEATSFLAPETMAHALETVRLESRVRPQDRIGCPEGGNPGFNNWVNQKRARLSFGLKGSQTIGGSGSSSNPNCDPPGGPFDPNDKTTETTLGCEFGFVEVDGEQVPRCVRYFVPRSRAAEPIEYTIQFENLPEATAPATFVTVTDVLDDDLDPSTLRVLQTSSDSTFSFTQSGQEVVFRFTDINLPPNTTPPIGEGFVTFEVSPRSGLADGTEIVNSAGIVFDFNPPIFTPEVMHELRQVADPVVTLFAPEELDTVTPLEYTFTFENAGADPAPDALLTITPAASDVQEVQSSSGTCEGTRPIVCDFGALEAGASVNVTVTQGPLPEGTTQLSGVASTSVFADTFFNNEAAAEITVIGVGLEDEAGLPATFTLDGVYPNPFATGATVRYGLPEAAEVEVIIYDLLGREVVRLADTEQAAGWHEIAWDAAPLSSGVYLCQFRVGDVVQTHKVTRVR
ncbi:MAG: T9SS type A sorting domain-containing protein, partial [Bacteroidota bacterium]